MRVGLVTNWGDRCGVAVYGQNLMDYADGSGVQFKQIGVSGLPLTYDVVACCAHDIDLLHFNYASGIFRHMVLEDWPKFRLDGKRTVMTFHDSSHDMTHRIAERGLFDRIVVHEKAQAWRPYLDSVVVIPQPIRMAYLSINREIKPQIGSFGFPFPWKGFERVAVAAKKLELGYLALLSDSSQVDANVMRADILKHYPAADVQVAWHDQDTVIQKLSCCLMNVFAHEYSHVTYQLYGISASVRLALAAQRPVVVTDTRQFRDLRDYEDEVYFVHSGLETTIQQVLDDIRVGKERKPARILADMNWSSCASRYLRLYEETLRDTIKDDARVGLSGPGT